MKKYKVYAVLMKPKLNPFEFSGFIEAKDTTEAHEEIFRQLEDFSKSKIDFNLDQIGIFVHELNNP